MHLFVNYRIVCDINLCQILHNIIIEQCVFVQSGPQNITMGCPNLVQGDSD